MSSKVAPCPPAFFCPLATLRWSSPPVRSDLPAFSSPGLHFSVSPSASRLSDSFLRERSKVPSLPCERSLAEPPRGCQTVFLFLAGRGRFPIHIRRPPRFWCSKMILLQPGGYTPWPSHPTFPVVTAFLICAGIMTSFGGYTSVSLSLSLICAGL